MLLTVMRRMNALLVLATAVVAGCAFNAPPLQVQGAWRIEQARSAPVIDKRQARLDFGANGRLSGHTSCNVFSTTYTLQGEQLRIGPVVSTRMACGDLQSEQEDRILNALELAATVKVRPDGLLEMRDREGIGVLRAMRFDAGPLR
jgi:heat shock protein HslJ